MSDADKIKDARVRWWAKFSSQPGALYAALLVIGLIIFGTVGYYFFEGWSWLDSFYTAVITVTTVGYGDYTPSNTSGKLFSVVFAITAIGIVSYTFSSMAAYVIKREQIRRTRKRQERKMNQIGKLQNHVILCGGDVMGSQVVRELQRNNTPFIVIEPDEQALRRMLLYLRKDYLVKKVLQRVDMDSPSSENAEYDDADIYTLAADVGVIYLQKNPDEDQTLITAGIPRAKSLISAMPTDKDNLFVVLGARQLAQKTDNSNLYIVSRVIEENNATKIKAAGADRTLSLNIIAGMQLANSALHPEIADFMLYLISQDTKSVRMSALHLVDNPDLVGKTISIVREQYNRAVIGLKRNDEHIYMPQLDLVLQADDILITMGT